MTSSWHLVSATLQTFSDVFAWKESFVLNKIQLKGLIANMSALYRVMALRFSGKCHYLIKCWPRSVMPYGIIGKQKVKSGFNSSPPGQNCRHFADGIFRCILLNENVWISIKISLNSVPKGSINIIPALVQVMAWRRIGDKPLSEPMLTGSLTHICGTRGRWVNPLPRRDWQ